MRILVLVALLWGCSGDPVTEAPKDAAKAAEDSKAAEEAKKAKKEQTMTEKRAKAEADRAAQADLLAKLDPAVVDPSKATLVAPDTFKVKFETTQGNFVIAVTKAWAPIGADRFYNLVKHGYYDDVAFFRTVPNFMTQFGMHGVPAVQAAWMTATIKDDPVVEKNLRGKVTFAKSNAPNSRTTQVFINFKNNTMLDGMGFAPFGEIVDGMEIVDALYSGYGDAPPKGWGPSQAKIVSEGNSYLKAKFKELDFIITARVIE